MSPSNGFRPPGLAMHGAELGRLGRSHLAILRDLALAPGRTLPPAKARSTGVLLALGLVAETPGGWRVTATGRAVLAKAGDAQAMLAQHRPLVDDTVVVEGRTTRVRRDAAESPLAWLRRRKNPDGSPCIGAAQFAAGERLRSDLARAMMLPRVTARWDAQPRAPGGGQPAAAGLAQVAAKQRIDRAMESVGPDLAGLLVDVCGFLKGLEQVEAERRWPARSAKVVLGIALDRLAAHYGYADVAEGRATPGPIRTWRAPGDGAQP